MKDVEYCDHEFVSYTLGHLPVMACRQCGVLKLRPKKLAKLMEAEEDE